MVNESHNDSLTENAKVRKEAPYPGKESPAQSRKVGKRERMYNTLMMHRKGSKSFQSSVLHSFSLSPRNKKRAEHPTPLSHGNDIRRQPSEKRDEELNGRVATENGQMPRQPKVSSFSLSRTPLQSPSWRAVKSLLNSAPVNTVQDSDEMKKSSERNRLRSSLLLRPQPSVGKKLIPIRYGDSLRLWSRSPYLGEDEGESRGGLPASAGGYVGVVKRKSKRTSVLRRELLVVIGPKGPAADGVFQEQDFIVVDPYGVKGDGQNLRYGDIICLRTPEGLVWNTATRGFSGYLGMRPMDTKGALSVSFRPRDFEKPCDDQSNGNVYYGDKDITILAEDCHRVKIGYSRYMGVFNKDTRNVMGGGYMCCDGKGHPLQFILTIAQVRISRIEVYRRLASSEKKGSSVQKIVYENPLWGDELSFELSPEQFNCSSDEPEEEDPPIILLLTLSTGGQGKLPFSEILKCSKSVVEGNIYGAEQERTIRLPVSPSSGAEPGNVVLNLSTTLLGGERGVKHDSDFFSIGKNSLVFAGLASLLGEVLSYSGFSKVARTWGIAWVITWLVVLISGASVKIAPVVFRKYRFSDSSRDAFGTILVRAKFTMWEDAEVEYYPEHVTTKTCTDTELAEDTDDKFIVLPDEPELSPMPRRFLISEKGDKVKAIERWRATLKWRSEMSVDDMLSTPYPYFDLIEANYSHGFHYHDMMGHLVYYELPGMLNLDALRDAGISDDMLVCHYTYCLEYCWTYAAPLESDKLTVIIDCEKVKMLDLNGEAARFLKKTVGIMASHYPQRSFKIMVVNAPYFFNVAFSLVKPLLNEATRDKISIIPSSRMAEKLTKVIPEHHLPVKYGGTSTVPLGQSPMGIALRNFVCDRLDRSGLSMRQERTDFPITSL